MRSLLPGFSPSNINASQPLRYHHAPPPHPYQSPCCLSLRPVVRVFSLGSRFTVCSACGVFALFVFSLLQLRTGALR